MECVTHWSQVAGSSLCGTICLSRFTNLYAGWFAKTHVCHKAVKFDDCDLRSSDLIQGRTCSHVARGSMSRGLVLGIPLYLVSCFYVCKLLLQQ